MKNYDLVLFHEIISEFEKNNYKEATVLHRHFIKVAQIQQNPHEKEAFDIIAEKGLSDQYKNFAIEYFKRQPQFDESDDYETIFNNYGVNNTILAEQFLSSLGNIQFDNLDERTEKGNEITEMLETLSESNIEIKKANDTLKVAIKKGLPIALALAGSAKLYNLLKYLLENREEIAKYASVVMGVISSILASLPPINFTLFNIQKIPTAYEIVEERRVINTTRVNNIYRYFIEYKTPDDNKNHEVTIVTIDENNDRSSTKIKIGPGQMISEPFESKQKYKSVKVYDNGKLIESQSGSEAAKEINIKQKEFNSGKSTSKPQKLPIEKNVNPNISTPYTSSGFVQPKLPKQKTKIRIGPVPEKSSDMIDTSVDTSISPLTIQTPTFNNRKFNTPDINIDTEPLTVSPSGFKIKPDIPEKKEEKQEDSKYYLENKPESAINKPEELGQRRSKIAGIHVFLDDLVENTLKRYLGENVSMKIHEYKTNEFDDVEQFVEFIFPNKKDNFIMEYKLNGNTGRRSMERHPADYFKKRPRLSLPKINLDDEQVQGILSGLLRKKR